MSVVGIDLGTTNTVVGCVRQGKVHVLADAHGSRLLPSVVSFHPNGEVLVGATARARRIIDPKNTVYSHKRLIGRSWGSSEIVQAKQRCAFELREGPGQGPLVHARGQDYTLPEISAFVLKRARQIAEAALGTSVERAVVTVPAHFNELQRASTKVAGRVAGLEVLRILNEPTAAALAYGLGRSARERVAVYDFGGGTFDCTLLDLDGNVFEVLASAGDSFLGGDDVDNLIAERMAESYLQTHRYDPRTDPQMFERLKAAAEAVKIGLSTSESHTVTLEELGYGASGAPTHFTFTLTRGELDAMITPLIDRTFQVTQDALSLARLTPTSFDKVILVGGSTRMPLVRRRVEAFFGAPPMDRVNPDEVVAIGAAIQAAALGEGVKRRSIPPPPPILGATPPRPSPGSERQVRTATAPGAGPRKITKPGGAVAAKPDPAAFGAIDEPPSLHSFPSATAPSATTTAGAGAMPSPIGEPEAFAGVAPGSAFGGLPNLSSIHDGEQTGTIEAITEARAIPSEDDDETVRGPMPTKPAAPRPFERTAKMQEAPPIPQSRTAAMPARPPAPPPPHTPAVAFQPPAPPAPLPAPPEPPIFGTYASSPPAAGPAAHTVMSPGAPRAPQGLGAAAPVLVDVTPRALVVETVGGFTDTIIPRNSKIPCERTRRFTTGRDMQTTVRVRVAQGESPSFAQNTYLGEVELSGLRAAQRGAVVVAVTFEVDADGTMRVRARDVQTGQEARASLQLVGVADEAAVTLMVRRFAAQPPGGHDPGRGPGS